MNITFNRKNEIFFDQVKEKIEKYFSQARIKRTGNYKIYIKSAVFALMSISCYLMILSLAFPLWGLAIVSIFLGVSFAGIGFNIMHDSAHGSFSSKKWLNELAAYSLNLMGGNIFFWKNKHNINHHTFTNIEGKDEDIDIEPWIRSHVNQPRHWYHRYQHIYSLVLYGLTYFNWVFVEDFKKYFSKEIAGAKLNNFNLKEHAIFWVSKTFFFSVFIIIPIIEIGFWKTVFVYTIMSVVCGFIMGIVFQLAHLVEDVEFPMPAEGSNKIKNNWILHQIATTVNFAPKNKAVFWFTGGLNFQVVHHLFPKINHIHYPKINVLIRETCVKFNIKYTEYPSVWSALRSHLSYLKRMGSRG
ncbi:MAG: NADPH-dependent stearoyl-CoA 9-desaturase [Chlamydiae bacterium]|nr:NADPH-dependent stearoyl-CoA 9-desaturase [Chlamydiota bacterium]